MAKREAIKSLKFLLASPEDILSWSYGEVTNAETINYRTLKPYMGGLMCERIFGPTKDYECYCGKYKRKKYAGIVCDKCGVEVTTRKVRRERMGHIRLAAPVVHIWYAYGTPNKLVILLDIPYKKLVSIIYYTLYVVTGVDEDKRAESLKKLAEIYKQEIASIKDKATQEEKELLAKQKELDKKLSSGKKLPLKLAMSIQNEYDSVTKRLASLKKSCDSQIEKTKEHFDELKKLIQTITYKSTITEEQYMLFERYGVVFFEVMMGAEAIKKLLSDINIDEELRKLNVKFNQVKGLERANVERKIKFLTGFKKNNLRPEWLVLDVLPVLPADLRPIVQLTGGRFASSDLNDLYRRVINRNNRLRELIELGAPEVIIRNEKRMLQEAVDALIDNQHRFSAPITTRTGTPLKSLTEILRGKKGRFRRNLLGKRVDYSGRAVIVPGRDLTINECGLPRELALEVYKPFVLRGLIEKGFALTIGEAKELFERKDPRVWDILEEVIKNKVVLLNRAPSLHKYSIQAFYPKLVEGHAIRINHLVTKGFNADFDGDAMNVFAILTDEALEEARERMLPVHNLIKAADGQPIVSFANDMIIGIYHLTYMDEKVVQKIEDGKQKARLFGDPYDAVAMYYAGKLGLHEPIYTIINEQKVLTSAGRIIFNNYLPEGFRYVNEVLTGSKANGLLREIVLQYNKYVAQEFLDNVKLVSLHFATLSGFSLGYDDIVPPKEREQAIKEAKKKHLVIEQQYEAGFISKEQRDTAIVELWRETANDLADKLWEQLPESNAIKGQVVSGAKGSKSQMGQISAMIGIVNDIKGHPVPNPIMGAYGLGLNPFEYTLAARGGRKGMLDTALNTRNAGYLTRKLVDIAQDVITRIDDCGYEGDGIKISRDQVREMAFRERIVGRYVTKDVVNPKTEDTIITKGNVITPELAEIIDDAGVQEVWVRSPLVCQAPLGICTKCYGYDFGTYDTVKIGSAVGVLAAQSTSEPATQLTLRTFHGGGVSKDITMGLPYLQELLEMRTPKSPAIISPVEGVVSIKGNSLMISGKKKQKTYFVLEGSYELKVENNQAVKKGDLLFVTKDGTEFKAPFSAVVNIVGKVMYLIGEIETIVKHRIPEGQEPLVKDGQEVHPGDILTSGKVDFKELAEYKSHLEVELELLDRMQSIFADFHVEVRDIHWEVIIRQMGKLAKIIHAGDTGLVRGSFANKYLLDVRNKLLKEQGKDPIVYVNRLLGITTVALNADSVLSAMSFQEQPKVLSEAAILGKTDYLMGLKENVIIGHLLPLNERAIITDVTKLDQLNE